MNISNILSLCDSYTTESVEKFKEYFLEEFNKSASIYDIKEYKISLEIDLLKMLSKYIKSTDIISSEKIRMNKGVLVLSCIVTRDNVAYHLESERIVAGGCIQIRHYRYITHTNLSVLKNESLPLLLQKTIDLKKVKNARSIETKINDLEVAKKREIDYVQTKMNMSDQEILIASHFTDKYIWENLNEYAQKSHQTKENFENYLNKEKSETIQKHRNSYNSKRIEHITKEYDKKINKLSIL